MQKRKQTETNKRLLFILVVLLGLLGIGSQVFRTPVAPRTIKQPAPMVYSTSRMVQTVSKIVDKDFTIVSDDILQFVKSSEILALWEQAKPEEPIIETPMVAESLPQETPPNPEILLSSTNIFDKQEDGKYNYAPSIIRDGDTYYSFFCTNKTAYKVIDSIGFVKSQKQADGTFLYTPEKKVLNPSDHGVDSQHVCDPSVIKGEFALRGQSYQYLMGYLCCVTTNNQDNDLGLAVSNDMINWEKWSTDRAFIDFQRNYDYNHKFQWGIGQPSLINLNQKGLVAIFFTHVPHDDIGAGLEIWDLADMDNPKQVHGRIRVSDKGLKNIYGEPDFITNADFMLDGSTLYMYVDTHPYFGDELSIVADVTTVYKMSIDTNNLSASIAEGTWEHVRSINKELTGYSKNHDVGFVRDFYGHKGEILEIAYTSGVDSTNFLKALWSYTIHILELGE